MADRPAQSHPDQFPDWADLKGAYRFFDHPEVTAKAIIAPHTKHILERCAEHPVVLAIQDDTHLSGRINREVHTTLAVLPDGDCLGILDLHPFKHVVVPLRETRAQRQQRWRESLVWSDAVDAIGHAPEGTRLIHVADRAADNFELFEVCAKRGVGLVVRAHHDRRVVGEEGEKLWDRMAAQKVSGKRTVTASTQRNVRGFIVRKPRVIKLEIRFATVEMQVPWNHPGKHLPHTLQVIYASEAKPPKGEEAIDWLLLTNEPVASLEDAERILGYYEHRWKIEEWHRVLKEGCGVEKANFDDPENYLRRAAVLAVVAVRLMQLRDLADTGKPIAQDPKALCKWLPKLWRTVAAKLLKIPLAELTPRQFLLLVAKRGGYIGRNSDPRPGMKVLWRGWFAFHLLVQGASLFSPNSSSG